MKIPSKPQRIKVASGFGLLTMGNATGTPAHTARHSPLGASPTQTPSAYGRENKPATHSQGSYTAKRGRKMY